MTRENSDHDDGKADLTEERLRDQFLEPYENCKPILVDGTIINPRDIIKIKIAKTSEPLSQIFYFYGNSPEMWRIDKLVSIGKGEDVTDDLIRGPPGYKKWYNEEHTIGKLKPQNNEIFIVHGHDGVMKQAVARTLEKLDLKPIILHEQPNEGRTIFEKFESYAENVSFAIVLLSSDDLGYKKDQTSDSAKLRARQNVILELGYFIGKLGRKNVVAIHGNVINFEFPSDILGIMYIPFDPHDGWKIALAKELDKAGYDIDFKKL